MEEEVTKAITTTVLKEYGNPDYSKVTKAINFAQEKVSMVTRLGYRYKLY